jgi:hypothetical protein
MARRFSVLIVRDVDQDDPRGLNTMARTARRLRMSEDPKLAATGAKWEAAIHSALERVLNGGGKRPTTKRIDEP